MGINQTISIFYMYAFKCLVTCEKSIMVFADFCSKHKSFPTSFKDKAKATKVSPSYIQINSSEPQNFSLT